MDNTKKVLIVCKDFKSVKVWLHNVLDIYMDIGLVTTWNSKKNKICMLGNYVWYFKEKSDISDSTKYYKVMTDDDLEKEWEERGWNEHKVQSDGES